MLFTSTRRKLAVAPAQVITSGISADGGLFVPESFPPLDSAALRELVALDYMGRAKWILGKFLTDFTPEEIDSCVRGAYAGSFENGEPAPLREISEGIHMLELWHGPTCAFKDVALQLLPFLLTAAAGKTAKGKTMVILVATSGDTGKAALEGFADVPGTRIIVFYPGDGVSDMQKLQMTTQEGANVAVCGIDGNFDDAQTGVKAIFADPEMRAALAAARMEFSSANSINFGRLVPQIVYYVSAYCDLLNSGAVTPGDPINIAVPTGNFGNILAAYYARRMGLPVRRFLCASNRNNILTDFLATGVYDRNRAFYTTESPSMDILISSNLERLLYHMYGGDTGAVASLMASLKETGRYEVSREVKERIAAEFSGGFCGDEATRDTIREVFRRCHYLCDTHTAVALNVLRQYLDRTGDRTPCVVASTASPYKFAPAVLAAISGEEGAGLDDFARLERLAELSGTPVPPPLAALKSKAVRHPEVIGKSEMRDFIRRSLGL